MRYVALLACALLSGCGGGGKVTPPVEEPVPDPGPVVVPAVVDASMTCLHPYPDLVGVDATGIELCSWWEDEEGSTLECARVVDDRLVQHPAHVDDRDSPIDEAALSLDVQEIVADWSVSPDGTVAAILVATENDDSDDAVRVEVWDLAGPARRLVTPSERGLYVDLFGPSFLVSSDHDDGGMAVLWHIDGDSATEVWTSEEAVLAHVMLDDRRLALFVDGTSLMVVDVVTGSFESTIPLAWLLEGVEDDFDNEGSLELDSHDGALVIAATSSGSTRIGVIGPDGARRGVDVPVCR